MKVEYRIKPTTRYIITRYHADLGDDKSACSAGSETRGEYDNADVAYDVAYALCKLEHDKSGQPADSMNFIYPERVSSPLAQG